MNLTVFLGFASACLVALSACSAPTSTSETASGGARTTGTAPASIFSCQDSQHLVPDAHLEVDSANLLFGQVAGTTLLGSKIVKVTNTSENALNIFTIVDAAGENVELSFPKNAQGVPQVWTVVSGEDDQVICAPGAVVATDVLAALVKATSASP